MQTNTLLLQILGEVGEGEGAGVLGRAGLVLYFVNLDFVKLDFVKLDFAKLLNCLN